VLLPGQREQTVRARALREGISIDANLLDDLRRLAEAGR